MSVWFKYKIIVIIKFLEFKFFEGKNDVIFDYRDIFRGWFIK